MVHQKNVLHVIEANLMQSMSRALHEGVTFDAERVNAVDWRTYPTIDIRDVPEVNAFLVNPDGKAPDGKFIPPSGAGETSTRPTAAAIANAIFDATGVRIRRQPLNAQTCSGLSKLLAKRPNKINRRWRLRPPSRLRRWTASQTMGLNRQCERALLTWLQQTQLDQNLTTIRQKGNVILPTGRRFLMQ